MEEHEKKGKWIEFQMEKCEVQGYENNLKRKWDNKPIQGKKNICNKKNTKNDRNWPNWSVK
jgi:hypothetical protein